MKSFKDPNSYIEDHNYSPLEWRASVWHKDTPLINWVEYNPCPSYSGLKIDISLNLGCKNINIILLYRYIQISVNLRILSYS